LSITDYRGKDEHTKDNACLLPTAVVNDENAKDKASTEDKAQTEDKA
jgi:hypothetical protein